MDTIPIPLLLDGATGTELIRRGMAAGVCTEQWVLDYPGVLVGLQREYVGIGAQVLMAPTFGANRILLEAHGIHGKVDEYNRRLVALSQEAAGGKALVAGDMAPTGQAIHPFGSVTFEELIDMYAEQAAALAEAGVDLFCLETFTTMHEARAALLAVRSVSNKPVWVSFTCDDNGRGVLGTDVLAAMIVMQGMGASAFGLNCTSGPDCVCTQLRRLFPYARLPLIAKPSAGVIDRMDPEGVAAWVPALAQAGARIFGGCCGTSPAHLDAISKALGEVDFTQFTPPKQDPDVIPCASEKEARFITPDVDVGEVIPCSSNLLEDILEAEESSPQGALKIAVLEEDDVDIFSEEQYAIKDALCLSTDVPELLERALRIYQGRAFWDNTEDIEPEFLDEMRRKYGLVLL